MMGFIGALPGAVSQGLIWGIMAIGVYITYKILDSADLTVDGSFCTGGAVFVVLFGAGANLWLALLAALLAGMLAGFVTGLLHTACGIPAILAGILTQLGLWSINLAIMGMKANVAINVIDQANLNRLLVSLRFVQGVAKGDYPAYRHPILVVGLFTAAIIAVLYWFFGTEMGSAIRATGNNENMARSQGMNTNHYKILGLALSNGMVSLSGALVSQHQGYADVKQGMGAIVTGLASIIIGEVILGRRVNFAVKLAAVVAGSCIYRIIVAMVLQMGLSTDDLKLLTAALVALALSIPVLLEKRRLAKRYCETGEEEKHA